MRKILFILLIVLSVSAFAQEIKSEPVIKVKGVAELKVYPDLGVLVLQMKHVDQEFNRTITGLNNKTNDVIKQLKTIGFKESEIKTIQFYITENRFYRHDSWIDSGYVATQNVEVEFKNEKEFIAKILNTFSKSKHDFTLAFNFKLSDTLKTSTREKIIKLAVEDAKVKSGVLAGSAGITLKKIREISYGFTSNEVMRQMDKMIPMSAESDSGMSGFTPQDIIFTDEVTISWEIE